MRRERVKPAASSWFARGHRRFRGPVHRRPGRLVRLDTPPAPSGPAREASAAVLRGRCLARANDCTQIDTIDTLFPARRRTCAPPRSPAGAQMRRRSEGLARPAPLRGETSYSNRVRPNFANAPTPRPVRQRSLVSPAQARPRGRPGNPHETRSRANVTPMPCRGSRRSDRVASARLVRHDRGQPTVARTSTAGASPGRVDISNTTDEARRSEIAITPAEVHTVGTASRFRHDGDGTGRYL